MPDIAPEKPGKGVQIEHVRGCSVDPNLSQENQLKKEEEFVNREEGETPEGSTLAIAAVDRAPMVDSPAPVPGVTVPVAAVPGPAAVETTLVPTATADDLEALYTSLPPADQATLWSRAREVLAAQGVARWAQIRPVILATIAAILPRARPRARAG